MTKEIWKSIPGYLDYEVSNLGRVRSYRRGKVRVLKGCPDSKGYSQVELRNEGGKLHTRVHKLVMLVFVGPCPDGMEICHNDGSPLNNCQDNLRYDTHAGNMGDRVQHGIAKRLTPERTRRIRQDYLNGLSLGAIAQKYDIGQTYIKRGLQDIYVPPRELSHKRIVSIREEYARGDTSYRKLAKKYCVDQSYICLIVLGRMSPELGGPIKGKDYPNTDAYRVEYSPHQRRERAKAIREEYAQRNITPSELSQKYAVSVSQISRIVTGKRLIDAGGPIQGIDY